MAAQLASLPRLIPSKITSFTTPSKRIEDGDDLAFFLSSTAYRDIKLWLFQLNRAVFPSSSPDGTISVCLLDSLPEFSPTITSLRALLASLSDLINLAPPETGPRRFGNVAFRKWFRLAEENVDDLLEKHVALTLDGYAKDDPSKRTALRDELKAYLLGGFGSAPRLDYGTGHELSFLAFLACLWKLDTFATGEERAIVVGLINPYLLLIRKLIITYTLEPAGSHGVWGLDDHSFLPYIFGSSQLGPAIPAPSTNTPFTPTPTSGSLPSAPPPDSITSRPTVSSHASSNMYFAAIQFIYDVKTGPFWEHSPTLFNISGIKAGWGKINKGMLKMWEAECLGKFPVVQHFPFGSMFAWERDGEAIREGGGSVHQAQQPVAPSKGGAGGDASGVETTKAPWAAAGSAMPSTTAPWATSSGVGSMGMPPVRAPWASAGRGGSAVPATTAPSKPEAGGVPPMRAPWASSNPRAPAPPPSRERRP